LAQKATRARTCTFCEIVSSDIKASIVFDDKWTLAFLDARPLFPGHCLLVPKQHVCNLTEIGDDLLEPLFRNARRLAAAVQSATGAEGTFLAINNTVSQSVPHLHIHIVPRNKGDGLKGFFWPRQKYRDEAHQEEVRLKIESALR
jgi:histidine triad (HIT) family protein